MAPDLPSMYMHFIDYAQNLQFVTFLVYENAN